MQVLTIGREKSNNIVLNDTMVSRTHAELTIHNDGRTTIKDLSSSNGVFVNGKKVTAAELKQGDVVKCGSVFLNWTYYLPGANRSPMGSEAIPAAQNEALALVPDSTQYALGDVFGHLFTRIFEIGNLFKGSWDRRFPIGFFNLLPAFLCAALIAILAGRNAGDAFIGGGSGLLFIKMLLAGFVSFSVCPFLTFYLLSLGQRAAIDKTALASGLFGFLHFLAVMLVLLLINTARNIWGNGMPGIEVFGLIMVMIFLLACDWFASIVLGYKYFTAIGISRSKAAYIVIGTICLNIFFISLIAWLLYAFHIQSIWRPI